MVTKGNKIASTARVDTEVGTTGKRQDGYVIIIKHIQLTEFANEIWGLAPRAVHQAIGIFDL